MTQALRSPLMLVGLLIVLFVAWGCGNNVTTGPAFQGPPAVNPTRGRLEDETNHDQDRQRAELLVLPSH